ncbi:MAG TPA: hypothetical protein QGF58_08815 [Myxococcota bacterium]|nr:hypothetical protein [Myxococcota bacterium]
MSLPGQIRELTERVRDGREVDPLETAELFARIQAAGSSLGPADVKEIEELLGDLEVAIYEGQAKVQERLQHSGRGRRALKGYGYVRSHKRGQRMRKKA